MCNYIIKDFLKVYNFKCATHTLYNFSAGSTDFFKLLEFSYRLYLLFLVGEGAG